MEEKEIDLFEYANILLRRWKLICMVTFIATAVAAAVSMLIPKVYESSATVSVLFPQEITNHEIREAHAETFERLIVSYDHISNAVRAIGLDAEPYDLTADDILKHLRVQRERYSSIISVIVRFWDPTIAMRLADAIAEEAVRKAASLKEDIEEGIRQRYGERVEMLRAEMKAASDALVKAQKEANLEVLKNQISTMEKRLVTLESQVFDSRLALKHLVASGARKRWEKMEDAIVEFKKMARLEVLEGELDTACDRLMEIDERLLSTSVEVPSLRAKLARYHEQISERDRILKVFKTIDTEPAVIEAVRSGDSLPNARELLSLRLESDHINPVYESLEEHSLSVQADLDYAETMRTELEKQKEELDRKITELIERMANQTSTLKKMEVDASLALSEYQRLAGTSEEGLRAQISVIEEEMGSLMREIERKRGEYVDKDAELKRLAMEYERCKMAYESASATYEKLWASSVLASPDLIISHRAYLPNPRHPAGPARRIIVVVTSVVAFFFSVMVAFIVEGAERRRRRTFENANQPHQEDKTGKE